MATKMGYAPGVRIQLKDNSAYTVVQNPNTVAGIVGYASKGELNKIIQVANTGELGVKLGYGYQSYKYNQGMYAANAVLTTGGEVEFVRPYGEEISRTDAYKRDLKTDAFVVAFDKNAALYNNNGAVDRKTDKPLAETSFKVKHFAATRYKTDGAAEFGVTRKINNIAETIESNNNVSFGVDASENYADSKEARLFDNQHCTDMVLFAIMNRDPSYANRAYDRYEVISSTNAKPVPDEASELIDCTLATKPNFSVGDTLFIPCTNMKLDSFGNFGQSAVNVEADVVTIDDKVVTIKVPNTYGVNHPDVLVFNDAENAIADGYDYLNIKTAVAGESVKNFASIKLGVNEKTPSEVLKTGTLIEFRNKNNQKYYVRLDAGNSPFDGLTVTGNYNTDTKKITISFGRGFHTENYLVEGDVLRVTWVDNATSITRLVTIDTINSNGTVEGNWGDSATNYTFEQVVFDRVVFDDDARIYRADVTAINNDTVITTGINAGVNTDSWFYVAQKIADALQSGQQYSRVAFTNDILYNSIDDQVKIEGQNIYIDPSAAYDYSIGDLVAIVRGDNSNKTSAIASEVAFDNDNVFTITAINPMGGIITVNTAKDIAVEKGIHYQLIDLTVTNATVYNSRTQYTSSITHTVECENVVVDVVSIGEGASIQYKSRIPASIDEHARVGTVITLKNPNENAVTFTVATIDGGYLCTAEESSVPVAAKEYATATFTYDAQESFDVADMYLTSSYTLYVSKIDQSIATVGELSNTDKIDTSLEFIQKDSSVFAKEIIKSPAVLADSDIGASFLALGLAKNQYVDVDFDGNMRQVYTLTEDGKAVARMFMAISYRFNGTLYEFEGTVAPFNYNGRQLSIAEAAEYELENSGLEFMLNDSGVLDYFLENNSYDLSQTVQNGTLNGSYTAIAYNPDDPAIVNDAVWTYDPQNNNSGSTLSTVWNLFVNKDASDVDMLIAAGVAINAPFSRKNETLNTQVMQAMINVCESRKDCFCVFDGVYEPDIQKAEKKMSPASQLSLGRWGFLYDGRGVFQDSLYTNSQADVMKSVQMAAIITSNRQGGVWWIPPSGDEAYVPGAWGTKERFVRSYNSEDTNCDHAKLSKIHVNATRVNKDGIRIWGDFTLQMQDTAFNQVHVTMLVAGIHKMFYKYLDHKVFKLNTTTLRAQITSDLQDKLNMIKRQNPSGLIEGKVICDDTNNTPEIIDQNFLIVDLKLLPPKSTRWIILRTTVESQKNGKSIATEVLQA